MIASILFRVVSLSKKFAIGEHLINLIGRCRLAKQEDHRNAPSATEKRALRL